MHHRSLSSADQVERVGRRAVGTSELVGACACGILIVVALAGLVPFPAALALVLLVPAGIVDVREHRLPDVWLATAAAALVVAMPISIALGGSIDVGAVALGAAVMCAPIAVLHLASPAAMGFGDVKLSIVLGAALGTVDWRLTLIALSLAGLFGATFGLATRRRTVAFGPFLMFATLLALLAGDTLVSMFLDAGSGSPS